MGMTHEKQVATNANPHKHVLEPAAQAYCETTANPPFAQDLPVDVGRKGLEDVQNSPVTKADVDDKWIKVDCGDLGSVDVRIVKPKGATGPLPVVFYVHGGGWVLGSAHTHDALVRDLCVGTGAAVVFPEYTRTPEAQYPTQNEQCYAVAQ